VTAAVRIANCSGFYGDRVAAAREMVEGGPIDYLTGDWLAELTMLILSRAQAKRAGGGYARTFVTQMEQVMGTCLDRGIKVVANAGGLDPAGCAEAVQEVADRLGLAPRIGVVTGDDLLGRLDELAAAGHPLAHLDTGEPLGDRRATAVTANAYLGCWGIVEALGAGADIVITGRVTDAAIVMAPAAHVHGWARTDWDRLAGACVAGHVIECGAQATGGNYAFFTEIPDLRHAGFPIAEVAADGSSVITKHAGSGGRVDMGTVASQLLYEIGSERYLNPDVVARFDTISLSDDGPDRVRIGVVRGEPAPPTLKVGVNYVGGYRNTFTFCLTGLDIEAKAALLEQQVWDAIPGGRGAFAFARAQLIRADHEDPATNEAATALLRLTVKDADERLVGRAFSNVAIELALASIPGFYGLGGPAPASPYGVFWPTIVPAELCPQTVRVGDRVTVVDATIADGPASAIEPLAVDVPPVPSGPTIAAALGRVVGARSGDKGGTANLGVFARSAEAYAWLAGFLTVERLRTLMPAETEGLEVRRYMLPNLWALNFLIVGLLEEGVAGSSRMDGQAKSLGEYLRAKVVDVPEVLLAGVTTGGAAGREVAAG
jgi:Acyclic terpene utilisation family protein AtuA